MNSLNDIINEYLLTVGIDKDGKKIKTNIADGTYFPKIKNFEVYLNKKISSSNLKWKEYLEKLGRDEIIESTEFFIESRVDKPITKTVGVKTYLIVINEFFRFLSINGIDNNLLLSVFDSWYENPNSIKYAIDKLKIKYSLSDEIDTQDTFSSDNLELLLTSCETHIERSQKKIDFEIKNNKLLSENIYKRFSLCVLLKLMMLTGIRCSEIKKITYNSLDIEHNTIKINGFYIFLPLKLRKQLEYYLRIRDFIQSVCSGKISENLFIWIDGSDGNGVNAHTPSSNNYYSDYLITVLSISGIMGLNKYIITDMLKNGIDINMIKKLTGCKNTIINHCLSEMYNDQYQKRETELKIRCLEMYEKL